MSTIAERLAQAEALRQGGQQREAEQLLRLVLTSEPTEAAAHFALGRVLAEQDRLDEAIACFHEAASLSPAATEIQLHLRGAVAAQQTRQGLVLAQAGRGDEAVACYRRALEAHPHYAPAYGNLGNLLATLGRLDDAAACFRRVIELDPGMAQAHQALAVIAEQQGHAPAAIAHYQRLLELTPGTAELFHRLAGLLAGEERIDEAAACYRRALELAPGSPQTIHNLGVMLARAGKFDEALPLHRQSVALQPDDADAHVALGGTLLILGRFAEGWPEYEWRTQLQTAPPPLQWKPWRGEALAGRTIVLVAEQARGDILQFIRYAPLIKQLGARVVFRGPPLLERILARTPGIDAWLTDPAAWCEADFCVPMLSVPWRLQTTLETIPANIPYIFADPKLIEVWRERLRECPGFRVGIVWGGSKQDGRSIPLAAFSKLAEIPGVRLVNLQKRLGLEQLPAFAQAHPIIDFGDQLDTANGAFMDTAAIMRNLDLVITADTATAHLAGALGANVWVALRHTSEWRWLRDRADSPWYPTMRLFRQRQPGDWAGVFQAIAEQLTDLKLRSRAD